MAVLSALAWWVGARAQAIYEALPAAVPPTPALRLAVTEYRRGWLCSQAVARLDLAAGDEITVMLRSDIHHGLLPVTWWAREGPDPLLALAVIRTGLAGDVTGSAVTQVRLLGDSRTAFTLPSLETPAWRVAGMAGVVHGDTAGRIRGEAQIAMLSLDAAVTVQDVAVQFDVRVHDGLLDGRLRLAMADGTLALQVADLNPAALVGTRLAELPQHFRQGAAQLTMTKNLLRALLIANFKQQLPAAGRNQTLLDSYAAVQADRRLALLEQTGVLRPDGDRYHAEVRLDSGRLFVNAAEVPLPAH
ncbi:MAG: YdgA family protein [Pseudomonadota bacterium]|nr:YdgA family protein [Pseudomonadota bacterium]